MIYLDSQYNKVAIYNRIPTYYEEEKLSLERRKLIDYCRQRLNIDSFEVFDEIGIFDREVDRPAYQEMMRRIRQKEFSHLIVSQLESIFHDYDDLKKLLREFEDCGVSFIDINSLIP